MFLFKIYARYKISTSEIELNSWKWLQKALIEECKVLISPYQSLEGSLVEGLALENK